MKMWKNSRLVIVYSKLMFYAKKYKQESWVDKQAFFITDENEK